MSADVYVGWHFLLSADICAVGQFLSAIYNKVTYIRQQMCM